MALGDLEDRVSLAVSSLDSFGEATLECPEVIDLENRVVPERLLDVLMAMAEACQPVISDRTSGLRYHPITDRPGVLYFHVDGHRHGPV